MRKRGVGTQVVQNPVHRRVELTSLFDDLARAGQDPTTQLLEYQVGKADDEVAARAQPCQPATRSSRSSGCVAPTASRSR